MKELYPVNGGSCHKNHFCRDVSFVATNTCLLRQTRICRDKTRFLSRQKYACRDKTLFFFLFFFFFFLLSRKRKRKRKKKSTSIILWRLFFFLFFFLARQAYIHNIGNNVVFVMAKLFSRLKWYLWQLPTVTVPKVSSFKTSLQFLSLSPVSHTLHPPPPLHSPHFDPPASEQVPSLIFTDNS